MCEVLEKQQTRQGLLGFLYLQSASAAPKTCALTRSVGERAGDHTSQFTWDSSVALG